MHCTSIQAFADLFFQTSNLIVVSKPSELTRLQDASGKSSYFTDSFTDHDFYPHLTLYRVIQHNLT